MASEDTATVTLPLQLTTHPVRAQPHLAPISIPSASYRTTTIGQVKHIIHTQWDGRPAADGLVLVLGGRVLRDHEVVEAVLEGGKATEQVSASLPCWQSTTFALRHLDGCEWLQGESRRGRTETRWNDRHHRFGSDSRWSRASIRMLT